MADESAGGALQTRITELGKAALAALDSCTTPAGLDEAYQKYLGKKGELSAIMKGFGALSPEEKKSTGQVMHQTRTGVEEYFAARKLALLAPDLVQGLVIINSSARGDTDVRRERNRVALAAQETRTYRGISRKALSRALHPDIETDKALIERLHAMSIRLGRQAFLNQLSIRREDERPTLGNIICPTLVVTGDQDRLRGIEEAAELRDGIPNADLVIIPDCGHMTPVEQPAALLKAIRDWSRNLVTG
ncbi:MAG: alpha/beta fold hydrolase [Leptospirales bacterium]